jgi:TonB family protein
MKNAIELVRILLLLSPLSRTAALPAQEPLDTARQLYAAAQYFALASSFYEPSLRAVVEVEVDAFGDVVSADVVQSSHPQYNAVLAKAALAWKYEPARRNGQPTKTRLRVDVVLKPK